MRLKVYSKFLDGNLEYCAGSVFDFSPEKGKELILKWPVIVWPENMELPKNEKEHEILSARILMEVNNG